MSEILKVEGLSKTFLFQNEQIKVLDGLDLSIEKGDIIGITGVSGAGKSTLLNIMGGLEKPTSGSVNLAGRDVFMISDRERTAMRRKSVAYIFQFHHLLSEFTAMENVMLPLFIRREKYGAAREKAVGALRAVDMLGRLDHRPMELSGGEQQRVAVARALSIEPEIILADEPTGNLDNKNSRILFDLIVKLNREKAQTFVIATHDESISGFARSTYRLSEGKLCLINSAGGA